MNWGVFDFALVGALVAGAGVAYYLTTKLSADVAYRCAVAIALVAAFLLIWVNLAAGVIGEEGDEANLMNAGVLAVGILGAVVARFAGSAWLFLHAARANTVDVAPDN